MVVVPTIFGAFFWKNATAAGSLTSIVLGSVVALYLQFAGLNPLGIHPGVWTFIITVLTFILVSLFTKPPKEKAEEFLGYLDRELEDKNIL
mgnify:CR=1 FL=1